MTKIQLIDTIRRLNRSADPSFLAQFEENELDQYLQRLLELQQERDGKDLLQPVPIDELG